MYNVFDDFQIVREKIQVYWLYIFFLFICVRFFNKDKVWGILVGLNHWPDIGPTLKLWNYWQWANITPILRRWSITLDQCYFPTLGNINDNIWPKLGQYELVIWEMTTTAGRNHGIQCTPGEIQDKELTLQHHQKECDLKKQIKTTVQWPVTICDGLIREVKSFVSLGCGGQTARWSQ